MERRFSLGQAVIVVLLLCVVATLVMPMCPRAHEAARRSDCRANLHYMALGLGQWQADHDQAYPVLLGADRPGGMQGIWEQLLLAGYLADYLADYMDETDEVVCPSFSRDFEDLVGEGAVGDASYGYDNARIDPNSAAGRIIMGDCRERLWADGRQPEGAPERMPANHDDGANVGYDDKAVVYIQSTLNFKRWIPAQGPSLTSNTYDFVREGVIQNTRIEEDGLPNESGPSSGSLDHDDAYAIEYDSGPDVSAEDARNKWRLLTDWEFETGLLRQGDAFVPMPKSKIDASVQPMRGFRHGTGWPSTGPEGARDIQTGGPYVAPAIWTY